MTFTAQTGPGRGHNPTSNAARVKIVAQQILLGLFSSRRIIAEQRSYSKAARQVGVDLIQNQSIAASSPSRANFHLLTT